MNNTYDPNYFPPVENKFKTYPIQTCPTCLKK